MSTPALEELRKLSVDERIQLVQDLWDSIAEDSEGTPLADEQREEIERRLQAHRQNPQDAQPWEEVYDRIRQSL